MKSAKEWQEELANKEFPESVSPEAIKRIQADAINHCIAEVMQRPWYMIFPVLSDLLRSVLPDEVAARCRQFLE